MTSQQSFTFWWINNLKKLRRILTFHGYFLFRCETLSTTVCFAGESQECLKKMSQREISPALSSCHPGVLWLTWAPQSGIQHAHSQKAREPRPEDVYKLDRNKRREHLQYNWHFQPQDPSCRHIVILGLLTEEDIQGRVQEQQFNIGLVRLTCTNSASKAPPEPSNVPIIKN